MLIQDQEYVYLVADDGGREALILMIINPTRINSIIIA